MRTRKPVFILISGKAGVGKTTLANYLVEKLSGYKGISVVKEAFENPIKWVAKIAFDWNGEKDSKGRRLLQVIGTDCGRNYNVDIWVKKTVDSVMDRNLYPPNFIVIDDWRFPNECSFIEKQPFYSVVTIRIEAENREMLKGTPEEKHISEISLPTGKLPTKSKDLYVFVVDNTTTFEELYRQGEEILAYLEKDFILE